jgi:hypothetical protein
MLGTGMKGAALWHDKIFDLQLFAKSAQNRHTSQARREREEGASSEVRLIAAVSSCRLVPFFLSSPI